MFRFGVPPLLWASYSFLPNITFLSEKKHIFYTHACIVGKFSHSSAVRLQKIFQILSAPTPNNLLQDRNLAVQRKHRKFSSFDFFFFESFFSSRPFETEMFFIYIDTISFIVSIIQCYFGISQLFGCSRFIFSLFYIISIIFM